MNQPWKTPDIPVYYVETVDFQPLSILVGGVAVTDATTIETLVIGEAERPGVSASWAPAVALGGQIGFMVEGFSAGIYSVWTRTADDPVFSVEPAGQIEMR